MSRPLGDSWNALCFGCYNKIVIESGYTKPDKIKLIQDISTKECTLYEKMLKDKDNSWHESFCNEKCLNEYKDRVQKSSQEFFEGIKKT